MIRDFSDSLLLPLDVKSFTSYIATESQKLLDRYEGQMKVNNLTADVGKCQQTKSQSYSLLNQFWCEMYIECVLGENKWNLSQNASINFKCDEYIKTRNCRLYRNKNFCEET